MALDLNAVTVLVAVAEERSFRRAANRLSVTRSAVSQSIRKLENQLGITLVQRTTSGPLLASFGDRYPEVRVDIVVTDTEFDIVVEGYDAGVRLGEVIAQDMVAVPVSAPQRQLAVATPGYLARCGAPLHPRDLPGHRCIGWRPAPGLPPYRWEFGEGAAEFDVAVAPEVTTNDMWLMIRLACAGGGITFGMEDTFRPFIARGELVAVLQEFSPMFPGFFLYFPSRHNLAPKLRALVDHVREHRRDGRAGAA